MEKRSLLKDWKKNIVKMSTLPRTIYTFNAIPYQNTINSFQRNGTNNLKIYMEPVKTLNSQRNVENKNQSWHCRNSRLYYKAVIIKTVWY